MRREAQKGEGRGVSAIKKDVRIGDCRLILGDCLEVMPALGKVDAVVTDPPYGIGFAHGGNDRSGIGGGAYATKFANKKIAGDDVPFDPSELLRMSTSAIVWGVNHFSDRLAASSAWLIWDKRASSGHSNDFADCEIAWTNLGTVARIFRHHWDGMMKASERGIARVHPTQKPIALMEWCLGFLPDAKTILDPFMGSGTTLVACAKLGRKGIGIELDPDYFEIACKRVAEAYRQPDLLIHYVPEKMKQVDLFDET